MKDLSTVDVSAIEPMETDEESQKDSSEKAANPEKPGDIKSK